MESMRSGQTGGTEGFVSHRTFDEVADHSLAAGQHRAFYGSSKCHGLRPVYSDRDRDALGGGI